MFVEVIKKLLKEIKKGTDLVVHCRAGIGRTGIVAAALLIAEGARTDDAFSRVSAARGVKVPDTEEQRKFNERLTENLRTR